MSKSLSKSEQYKLVQIIGQRLKAARELCNLSQTTAAKKLGYLNSTKLSKIERASDSCSIPLWLIFRASQVYEVSVDYLFGVSDDWESDARKTQERVISPWLWAFAQRNYSREMTALRKLNDRLQKISDSAIPLADSVIELRDVIASFRDANPWFDEEAKLGAKLLNRLAKSEDLAVLCKSELKRFEKECKFIAMANSDNQLFLPFEDKSKNGETK